MNALEQYIGDLSPTCWYRSDMTNGYGMSNPVNGSNITQFKNIAQPGVFDGVFDIVGSNPPKYVEGGANGLPYLEFLATNNNTIRVPTPTSPYGSSERTVILIFSDNTVNNSYMFQHDFGGAGNGNLTMYMNNGFVISTYQSGVLQPARILTPLRGDLRVILFSQKNGDNYNLFNDNYRLNTMNLSCITVPLNTPVSGGNLVNGFSLGNRFSPTTNPPNSNSTYATYRFYELIIFPKQLNLAEAAQVQTYIKLKYNT